MPSTFNWSVPQPKTSLKNAAAAGTSEVYSSAQRNEPGSWTTPKPGCFLGCQAAKYAPAGSVKPPMLPRSRTSIGSNAALPPAPATAAAVAARSGDWKETDQALGDSSSDTVITPPTYRPSRVSIP